MAQSCSLKLFPIMLGSLRFDQLPPGLRYGLSTTNCVPFPQTVAKPDAGQMAALLKSMRAGSGPGQLAEAGGATGTAPATRDGDAAGAAGVASDASAKLSQLEPGLAPVPDSCPALPAVMGQRAQVFEMLRWHVLPPGAAGGAAPAGAPAGRQPVIVAHGMGGAGKTVMAAAMVQDTAVRRWFSRTAFVVIGQTPALGQLQRDVHMQLVGEPMKASLDASSLSARAEALAAAAAGQRWLLVLDDVWDKLHTDALWLVGEHAPECKMLLLSRFAGLLPGVADFPLGLLSPDEALELLFETASLDRSEAHDECGAEIVKLCGLLPLFVTSKRGTESE